MEFKNDPLFIISSSSGKTLVHFKCISLLKYFHVNIWNNCKILFK